jgi:hypothetical protein
MSPALILMHEGEEVPIAETSLLIFIDETGHEELSDPDFPVFGFGGCVCLARDYIDIVHVPWGKVESQFSNDKLPLHASDLRPSDVTKKQISAISSFFTSQTFSRFACVITGSAIHNIDQPIFHTMALATYARIRDVAKEFQFDNIVMIFEDSTRTNLLMADYFSRYEFNENDAKIPIQRFRSPKGALLKGLTVADFVAHTAGASVNARLNGKITKSNERRDFQNIFMACGPKLASFIEITGVNENDETN